MNMLITYRSIKNTDLDNIKELCEECFPVRYPERWFNSLTASTKYFTLAAIDSDKLVGLIVAKIKSQNQCNPEDMNILNQGFFRENKLVYILTLGVTNSHRNHGIASELLNRLLSYVNSQLSRAIKGVYLHVLTTNTNAIYFYERRGFNYAQMLPNYYFIDGKLFPAFTYILYLNGGCPQKCIKDYVGHIASYLKLLMCVIARFFMRVIRQALGCLNIVPHRQWRHHSDGDHRNSQAGIISNARLIESADETKFSGNSECLSLNAAFKSCLFSKTGYDSSPLRL